MCGDNSKEALGLTVNYNKPPDVRGEFLVSLIRGCAILRSRRMGIPIEITPAEVKRRMDAGEELTLLDVREPDEYQICRIESATLVPMREVSQQFDRLEEAAPPLIVFCHHGVRSLTVVSWLREQGLTECQSMAGGIDAWSRDVDPDVPRY